MPYSGRMQNGHYYSVFFAPRGRDRMYDLGMQIAQMYLSPYDKLIGIIGEAGSGKSMLIKGMFPGLELTNDDNGINMRPLPILDQCEDGYFRAHTYHLDIRFESAFTQMGTLADAIRQAVQNGKRVIVEHFDMIYPLLGFNANLMIGLMAHTAEDLCEIFLPKDEYERCFHRDIKHGFLLAFEDHPPKVDLDELELKVSTAIASDLPISYVDDGHVRIGNIVHPCTGPRTHVSSTGKVEEFRLLHRIVYDPIEHHFLIAGRVGPGIGGESIDDVNDFNLD